MEDEKLEELKSVYDELWSDAKTVIKDMRKSVYIYNYAALLTYAIAVITIVNAAQYYAALFLGHGNIVTIAVILVNVVGVTVEIVFGTILLRWYNKMKRRYARLIEMEKSWRKTDA